MTGKHRSTFAFFTGVSLAALGAATPALAQTQEQGRVTDEIVVTAEKREASIQDVPIAISAFDESRLERLQLNDAQDLQLAIPNFQFSKQNFTGSNVAIRGVGTKVVATSGDAAVGIHINGAPVGASPIFEGEFFDVQRVEVLRGPQGTLYGRNSSSGVLNIITQKAVPEEFSGRIEGTYGNFNTYKTNGYINIPIGDTFAARIAGFYTKRDGFSEDIISGSDVDGRDMFGVRGSLFAQLADNVDASLVLQYFKEDSNRSRIGKQLCTRDNRPWPFSQGCLNTGLGFDAGNSSASLGGLGALIFPGFDPDGAGPLQPTLLIDNPALAGNNPDDYRKVALTYQPKHEVEDFFGSFEFNWDFGPIKFTSLSSFTTNSLHSSVDYTQSFGGQAFRPTALNPTGPFTGPRTGTQAFLSTFDNSGANTESFTQEFRLTSDLDGWFNYTIGYININSEVTDSTYQIVSNSLEAIALGLQAQTGFNFTAAGQSFYENFTGFYNLDASAIFGEMYFTPTDDLKVTLGLRRTSDDKVVGDRQTLLQPVNRNSVPLNVRRASFDETTGRLTVAYNSQLPFTDKTNWYASYARGYKGGGLNPPIDPTLFAGVASSFDPEFVNSYEVGMKNIMGDGRLTANFAGFYYDYQGYQITRIVNRTSVNANLDATIKGLEAEFTWEPVNGLVFDLNVGYLQSEITDSLGGLVDPINVTNGSAGYTGVSDALRWNRQLVFDSGGNFLGTFGTGGSLASVPAGATVRQIQAGDLLGANGAAVQGAAGAIAGTPSLATISTAARCIVSNTAITTIQAINPALLPFACQLGRGFGGDPLSGSDGIKRLLEGNDLPNTPEWTVSFGAQYTLPLGASWAATARADYYYQADSFSRIFNTQTDQLDSYSQINASLRFENKDAGLYASVFVKNIADDDVVTDLYLTDQSSGLFTNAFLLEPRTFGVTLGKRW